MAMMKNMFATYILFVLPTFLSGAASVMDMFGSLFRFNIPMNSEMDRVSLNDDWRVVGNDIYEAMKRFGMQDVGKYE